MATSAKPIITISGNAIPLPDDDVDTDRIIPARFMRCVTFDGLGEHAFHDERFESDGTRKNHPLNDPRYRGGNILIVGNNFGCGSSREHAPQALRRFGIDAFIGLSFADIFAGNCVAIGLPAVRVSPAHHQQILKLVQDDPSTNISLNLENLQATVGSHQFSMELPESHRVAFTQNLWDTTAVLLQNKNRIEKVASSLPYTTGFAQLYHGRNQ